MDILQSETNFNGGDMLQIILKSFFCNGFLSFLSDFQTSFVLRASDACKNNIRFRVRGDCFQVSKSFSLFFSFGLTGKK